jgi:hypothetical protein
MEIRDFIEETLSVEAYVLPQRVALLSSIAKK